MKILVSGGTATLRRLAPLYSSELGVLLTPANGNKVESVVALNMPWACDNGCFAGFDEKKYLRMIERVKGQQNLLWVTAPDVVGDHAETLRLFKEWQPKLAALALPVAFVAQDGCESLPDVPFDALFIGGTTEYKLGPVVVTLVSQAKSKGKFVHMGRVNSMKRIKYAMSIGVDSVDGTAVSRFGNVYLEKFASFIRLEKERANE